MSAQRGFALIEFMIAAVLATLLAVWGADSVVRRMDDAAAQASASWMLSLRGALQGYLERYGQNIKAATVPSALLARGYADWARPTMAELKADGLLSAGFPEAGSRGLTALIRVLRQGVCPGALCRLDGLIHSSDAMRRRPGASSIDEQGIAQWLLASGGWGGWISPARPSVIGGAAFSLPNPPPGMPTLASGTVAMAVTAEQMGVVDYLRVRDDRDPDFQGSLSLAGDLQSAGAVKAAGTLQVGAVASEFGACDSTGSIARENYGGLLVCRAGLWRSAGRGGGGGFMSNSLHGCNNAAGQSTANPITGKCTCPVGHESVTISDSGPHPAPEGRTRGYICVQ